MSSSAPPPPTPPTLDFHAGVALTRAHPPLARLLGLALELRTTTRVPAAVLNAGATQARLTVTPTPPAGHRHIRPWTACTVTPSTFTARPRAGSDLLGGRLRLGDPTRFRVITVDPDGGAIKALQFAANLTRSHTTVNGEAQPRSSATPGRFGLPALRTGGLSLARLGRASGLAATLAAVDALNTAVHGPGQSDAPVVYADDVVRGCRVNVYDVAAQRWYTVMSRTATYEFLRTGAAETAADEGTVVGAPATHGGSPDLHLPESLTRWTGWSLAVPRPGRPSGWTGRPVGGRSRWRRSSPSGRPTASPPGPCPGCASVAPTGSGPGPSTSPAAASRRPAAGRTR